MAEKLLFGLPPEQLGKVFRKIIDRSWFVPGFSGRIQKEPRKVARELGWDIPPEFEYRFVQDSDQLVHFVVPAPPPPWKDTEVRG